jgi:hypothetical protein
MPSSAGFWILRAIPMRCPLDEGVRGSMAFGRARALLFI